MAFILIGVVILSLVLLFLFKFKSLKLSIKVMLFTNVLLYSYLIFLIDNEGGIKFIEQLLSGEHFQAATTFEQKSEKQISYVEIKEQVLLDVPIISQFPELPRGCEVTSLAMLLQYKEIKTDKMDLAAKIKKDTTPFKRENGLIYWGSPNNGFIGDMYSYSSPGYGVYHKPIKELAEQFLPGQIIDLTGSNFEQLKRYLSQDIPIWIIINTTYKKLPDTAFETWQTPEGEMKITYKEHSVIITGYDEQNIYFNDPISGIKNRVALKAEFIEAWVQMGRQAVAFKIE